MKTPLMTILAIVSSLFFVSAVQAGPMTCDNNENQKNAAQVLAANFDQFDGGTSLPAVEIADINNETACNTNWAFEALGVTHFAEKSLPTCGVKLVFSDKKAFLAFARMSAMLTPDSTSTISQMEKGNFSSRDPHDPYGNEQMVKRSVVFCAALISNGSLN